MRSLRLSSLTPLHGLPLRAPSFPSLRARPPPLYSSYNPTAYLSNLTTLVVYTLLLAYTLLVVYTLLVAYTTLLLSLAILSNKY